MNIKTIEKRTLKKDRKEIYSKVIKAIKDFNLIKENDKIAVCISGGKDSFLLAKTLQQLQKYYKVKFDLKYIVMDPGYTKEHLKQIKENAFILGLDIDIFKTDIFKIIKEDKSPCYKCAKMRRGYLYNRAKELGCNKIALGHHFNDVIETTLLGLFYNGKIEGMLPKIKSDNFKDMELIRPLYYVYEKDIISWANNSVIAQ